MRPDGNGSEAAQHDDIEGLRRELASLQDERVEDWLRLIRHGEVIPAAVERSLSWRLTRPVRLAQTAVDVLRRDGFARFRTIAATRLRRVMRR